MVRPGDGAAYALIAVACNVMFSTSRVFSFTAMAQGVVRRPKPLMLDEPSAGLSPVSVDRVLAVATVLRADGTSVLLVEQAAQKSLGFADRVHALAGGHIVLEAATSEPDLPQRLEHTYFGEVQR